MPIILRGPNNPIVDTAILTAVKTVAVGYPTPNTQLAIVSASQTGAEQVYVQAEFTMFQNGVFPALLLSSGQQAYTRASQRNYDGTLQAYADYYDVWAETTRTLDQIRADVATDLERIKANIESNDSLTIGNTALTISAPRMSLSPYEGMFKTYGSVTYIWRRLAMSFLILPYDV